MLRSRVIPVLLTRNRGLVKSTKFDKAKYIGDPINAVKIFNDKEVDEIVVLDIDASKEGRGPDFTMISNIASECFMPLACGGGIRNLNDIQTLFQSGVEKVILNSVILNDFSLITEAAKIYGDQSIVASVDVKKNIWGKYQLFSHSNLIPKIKDPITLLQGLAKAGAGEIMINSVDLDGTMSGYDLKLIELLSACVDIPIVFCGGAGSVGDLLEAYKAGASGVAAGSLFIYHGPHKAVLINYPTGIKLIK
jgi:cyclase